MRVVETKIVVAERLDDPAISDFSAAAHFDHAFELTSKTLKAVEALIDGGQLNPCNAICLVARLFGAIRKAQQIPDGIQRESESPSVTHEGESFAGGLVIASLVPFRADWRNQKADLLVISDGWRLGLGHTSDFTDRIGAGGLATGLRHTITEKHLKL